MSDINFQALQLLISRSNESDLKTKRLRKRTEKMRRTGKLNFKGLPKNIQYSLCCARLTLGDFTDYSGWEYRNPWAETFLRFGEQKKIDLWDGKPGKVYVLGEQGVGDEIMFSSVLPDLIKTNEVVFECEERLVNVFKRSFDIEVKPRESLKVERDGKCIALADLSRFYRRSRDHFPRIPYIIPDAGRVAYWRDFLRGLGPPPYIGIAWKARHGQLDPYQLVDTGTYISLQYGEEIDIPRPVDPITDFEDQINLIAALDQVRSVTQTVVHVAGSLGVECDAILDPRGFKDNNLNHPWYYHSGEYMEWYPVNVFRSIEEWQDQKTLKIEATG